MAKEKDLEMKAKTKIEPTDSAATIAEAHRDWRRRMGLAIGVRAVLQDSVERMGAVQKKVK